MEKSQKQEILDVDARHHLVAIHLEVMPNPLRWSSAILSLM
jgi:hypothetical protein